MPVVSQFTPNPNALKFNVGREVGGPRSYTAANASDDPIAGELFAIEGVVSVFMTSDFVTVTKSPDADWADLTSLTEEVLNRHFS
ncbi:MAG: scaffolding protein [Acidimicrobiia bacterium]|nr:NifU N-terminal domain-containing protein [bacterium]MXX64054.1 scaffolding protein [Acidimicrobiia bacterium]MCY3579566.1 NifU N-terminal domain-containing protein [bacterium]MCY3651864.1 NifU N-terminal domain-containing protein [bacterium]MDE0642691.1 NifU N-terminal domain-containing protein [bacterium]